MKKIWFTLSALAAIGVAQPAAAYVYCEGTIAASWVNSSNAVLIQPSWHASHVQICSLTSTWKGIGPEACAAWMAKMDAATSLERAVTVYYPGESDCAAIPTYDAAPAPGYVMLR